MFAHMASATAIHRTALFTVEGELDDICAIGQTMAALDLCAGISPLMKRHHLQTGVGPCGVFSGRRSAGETYPQVREFIQSTHSEDRPADWAPRAAKHQGG